MAAGKRDRKVLSSAPQPHSDCPNWPASIGEAGRRATEKARGNEFPLTSAGTSLRKGAHWLRKGKAECRNNRPKRALYSLFYYSPHSLD